MFSGKGRLSSALMRTEPLPRVLPLPLPLAALPLAGGLPGDSCRPEELPATSLSALYSTAHL